MKRMMALLIVLVMMILPAGALAENWYLEQGLALAERLDAFASDETYCALYTSSEEILKITAGFAAGDYSKPEKARMLVLPDAMGVETVISLMGLIAGEEMPELSDTVMNEIANRLPDMLVSLFNGGVGVEWVAASSVLRCNETHIMPEDFTPGVLFLDYPGDYGIAVSFSKTGAETITAGASIIPGGSIDTFTGNMPFAAKLLVGGMFRDITPE